MNATQINWEAVRTFQRVWGTHEQAFAETAAADMAYDAGEWSGPAIARAQESSFDAAVARVGARYGYTADYFGEMVWVAGHVAQDRFMAAVLP